MDVTSSEPVSKAVSVTRCRVPAATRALGEFTNAYVLGHRPAMLVDPASRTDELDRAIRNRGVEHLLVTHAHPDHVGALASYANETGATVWARRGQAHRIRAATGIEPDRQFTPETTVSVGSEGGGEDDPTRTYDVRLLDAPGHAPDHVAIRVGSGGPILCGDCVVREGSVVVGAPDGDMRAYLSTLRRLRAMDPPRLLPGHGPEIDDPRGTLERLISHRLARERRVLAAVDAGSRTLEEVLETAYEKDLTGVRELALATTDAHLEKLSVERRIAWDGDRARPVDDGSD